jgi:hypothetical protein
MWHGRPWELATGPTYETVRVPGTRVTVSAPRGLALEKTQPEGDATSAVYGSLAHDAAVVAVHVEKTEATALSDEDVAALSTLYEGAAVVTPPHVEDVEGRRWGETTVRLNGTPITCAVLVEGGYFYRLELALHPDVEAAWSGMPAHVVASLQTTVRD